MDSSGFFTQEGCAKSSNNTLTIPSSMIISSVNTLRDKDKSIIHPSALSFDSTLVNELKPNTFINLHKKPWIDNKCSLVSL